MKNEVDKKHKALQNTANTQAVDILNVPYCSLSTFRNYVRVENECK